MHFLFIMSLAIGSTVVAFRTPSEIIVGADSKVRTLNATQVDSHTECKIRQVGNMFFVITGLRENTWGRFNVAAHIIEAHKKGGTIRDTVEAFEKLVRPSFIRLLDAFKREQPRFYQQHLLSREVGVIFFGWEKHSPVFYTRRFLPEDSTNGSVDVRIERFDCPWNCKGKYSRYSMLGETEAIERLVDAHKESLSGTDGVKDIRMLIELEIADRPDKVGPPIDILRIDKNGPQWIQKQDECPNIEKYTR